MPTLSKLLRKGIYPTVIHTSINDAINISYRFATSDCKNLPEVLVQGDGVCFTSCFYAHYDTRKGICKKCLIVIN